MTHIHDTHTSVHVHTHIRSHKTFPPNTNVTPGPTDAQTNVILNSNLDHGTEISFYRMSPERSGCLPQLKTSLMAVSPSDSLN